MTKRVLIRGGTIVTPDDVFRGNILVEDKSIVKVLRESQDDLGIPDTSLDIVDATGSHILPGLIDAHVHLRDPGATHKEDFGSGTRAALAGGVTTVLDMPNNPHPVVSYEALEEKRARARAQAVCDYGLFVGATSTNAETLGNWGAVGIKIYMGATTGDLLLTDFESLYRHFVSNRHLPIVVHAEDNEALGFFGRELSRTRHSEKRPPVAAEMAVARALALAHEAGHPLHFAHTSTAGELALIRAARSRGISVTCEIAPQHLFLSTQDEERLGAFGVVNPPLRTPEDVRALWENVADWDMVATDHAPHTIEEKRSDKPPSGIPGLETMLPLLLTAASENRLSLQEIVRLTSRNPARVFNLASKGEIAPGYDADLTLVKLDARSSFKKPWQTKCNWSPFEGMQVRGQVTRVLLRGYTVMANGEILAEPGYGNEVEKG